MINHMTGQLPSIHRFMVQECLSQKQQNAFIDSLNLHYLDQISVKQLENRYQCLRNSKFKQNLKARILSQKNQYYQPFLSTINCTNKEEYKYFTINVNQIKLKVNKEYEQRLKGTRMWQRYLEARQRKMCNNEPKTQSIKNTEVKMLSQGEDNSKSFSNKTKSRNNPSSQRREEIKAQKKSQTFKQFSYLQSFSSQQQSQQSPLLLKTPKFKYK